MPLAAVRTLIALLEVSDARELEVRTPTLQLALRKGRARRAPPPPRKAPPPQSSRHHQVCAPLTGIWYDSPSPGTPPYVQPGSIVDEGAVIGLIETMKIFNEITTDVGGGVTEVLARRGQLVARNSPLMTIDTTVVTPAWPIP